MQTDINYKLYFYHKKWMLYIYIIVSNKNFDKLKNKTFEIKYLLKLMSQKC